MSAHSAIQDLFFDPLGFPDASRVDKRIFKRMLLENCQPTSADKKAVSADVDALIWKYTLKASTIQVKPYEDGEREYLEVAVIEMVLKSRRRAGRLAELVHRAIPYPVLLVMVEDTGVCVSVAHKRLNRAEAGSIVAEGLLNTPWMDQPLTGADLPFRDALALQNLSRVDFYALYGNMVDAVLARTCADLTGRFVADPLKSETERRAQFEACRQMEHEIANLRSTIHKEVRFAEKVELNTRIKALEAALAQAKVTL